MKAGTKSHSRLGWACGLLLAGALALGAAHSAQSAEPSQDPRNDPKYDRLDGTGESGKKVNVIEWEGNLEVHVYPAGSLVGLALKLDEKNKGKRVLVIGYRFDNAPKTQIIRRNILGIPLREGFKAYRDPSADDYDKVVISNSTLSGQVTALRLDPPPTQLYPDGHPTLAKTNEEQAPAASGTRTGAQRVPANGTAAANGTADGDAAGTNVSDPHTGSSGRDSGADEDGTIQPFFMQRSDRANGRR